MEKYKYLLKNIGLLTLSSFATKLLSFFLVPLYTNILSATEYGTYDFFNAMIGVLLPVLTMNIQDAVMRFAMDKRKDRKAIVSIATRYMFLSCVFLAVALCANEIFGFVKIVQGFSHFFFAMYFVQVLSGIVLSYIRGIDKIAELSISSVIASIVTIVCNVVFLVFFKWGLVGYFLANILGPLSQCLYLIFCERILTQVHLLRRYQTETREMLDYSKPLIANSIAWWVNNVSDRYIVTYYCGLAENGIYSISSKIPSILNIFQSIFAQAWTLSAVKDFDAEDKQGFFSNTYKAYNCLMVIVCSAIIVFDKLLAKILYAKDFFAAWKYVPWLTIAIVFGSLSGYIGGFFSAVKNSKIFARSTMIGAVTNIILNIIFTPLIGALGASIATALCYFIVWAIRYAHSKRYIKLRINIYRDILSYIILSVQSVILLVISDNYVLYSVESLLFVIIVIIYFKDLVKLYNIKQMKI